MPPTQKDIFPGWKKKEFERMVFLASGAGSEDSRIKKRDLHLGQTESTCEY
jgi:hypothetical protein